MDLNTNGYYCVCTYVIPIYCYVPGKGYVDAHVIILLLCMLIL